MDLLGPSHDDSILDQDILKLGTLTKCPFLEYVINSRTNYEILMNIAYAPLNPVIDEIMKRVVMRYAVDNLNQSVVPNIVLKVSANVTGIK
uniref:Uncharacterized protein n=1 Tax=Acrobeloides nanus TaxID=290746 RepID=A0A914CM81_9BILA